MKERGPLLVAVLLGALAAILYWFDLSSAKQAARAPWELQLVVVADVDIDEGTILQQSMISQRGIPKQFITPSVIPPDNFPLILGQRVMVPIKAGDPLLWTEFESSKGLERLSNAVPRSFRAYTLPVSGKDAVGGHIRPNDHVDILLTYHNQNDSKTLTILENVLVLATGKIDGMTNLKLISQDELSYGDVTVEVVPDEVEILALAQELGHMSLSVRNPQDYEEQPKKEVTSAETVLTGVKEALIKTTRIKRQGPQVMTGK